MAAGQFWRMLADQAGVSVVADAKLDGATVSLDVSGAPVSAVLAAVSRRLGVEASQVGGVWYIGELRPEDRGVLVRKVRRLGKEELAAALLTLQSEHGRSATFEDGLVVVGDTLAVLQRVNALLDQVDSAPSWSWVVQLHVIAVDAGRSHELGFDITPAADLAVKLAAMSGSGGAALAAGASSGATVHASLSAMLQAAREDRGLRMEAEPMVLCIDGVKATVSKGVRVPITQRSISPEGTSTVSSITFQQTGLVASVLIRDLGESRGRLDLHFELSDILSSSSEGLPTTSVEGLDTTATIASGGYYLLGMLNRSDRSEVLSGPLKSKLAGAKSASSIQIWATVFRIAGVEVLDRSSTAPIAGAPSALR